EASRQVGTLQKVGQTLCVRPESQARQRQQTGVLGNPDKSGRPSKSNFKQPLSLREILDTDVTRGFRKRFRKILPEGLQNRFCSVLGKSCPKRCKTSESNSFIHAKM
ncbi:MAG: hypothetical protein MUD08_05880, partial [Cytophagales bacterium]|nr:hypothetical protein [Cytophagales bacterium]